MLQLENPGFEEFFDAIYQYIAILDARGKLVKANRTMLDLTGLSRVDLAEVPLWSLPWPALSRENRRTLKQAVKHASLGKFVRSELHIHKRGQPEMILDFSLKPIADENGGLKFMIVEGRDITTDKLTTEALYQSEARFKTIFEQAGVGIVIKGLDGKMLDCNSAFQSMLGYTSQELQKLDYLDITHPHDRSISRKLFSELINGKRKSYSLDKRYLTKDGEIIWGRITTSVVLGPDGEAQFVIGMVENITANKQIEAELVELQQRLMHGREIERLKIAQDLHDGPLQEIIGVSYQIQALENNLPTEADNELLHGIQEALQQLTKSVRSICGELRPPTLVPFGLEKAILSHAEEFQGTHAEPKIELSLAHDGQTLSEQVRIALYRIYQETLNNVLHHSHAATVWVRFMLDEEHAILEIQDDGVGFELPNRWITFARQGHLGLVGAMERARDIGGSLEITTAPGQGTLVRATLPVKEETLQSPEMKTGAI
jgi:PAS domain S-box-containing protein